MMRLAEMTHLHTGVSQKWDLALLRSARSV